MKSKLDKFIKNPKKAVITLALPIIVAMFVQTMYTIVDTAYIGRLGADALAALTFAFPLFFLLMSLGAGIGAGTNSRISRFIGEKNIKGAENAAMHGILLSVLAAIIIISLGLSTLKPLLSLLGAQGNVLLLTYDYASIIIGGSIFMFLSMSINTIFAAQGNTSVPMKVQITGLMLNFILDPIFIFALHLGVKGAAIATVIGFFFSTILYAFYKKESHLAIHKSSFKFSPKLIKQIFSVGFPASLLMMMISMYSMFFNNIMSHFGTDYVAAFGMVVRLESFVTMPIVALSMSVLTLTGMFFGAKKYHLLDETMKYAIKVGLYFNISIAVLFFAFPKIVLRIFTTDQALLSLSADYLRIYVFVFPTIVIAMITSRVLQGIGDGISGTVIHAIRIFAITIPLAYLFIFYFDLSYTSLAVAAVIGNLSSNFMALFWVKRKIKLMIPQMN